MDFYILSSYLQLAEPLMEKYYDYDKNMLNDEIQECIIQESESNDLINSEILKNFLNTNYRDIFEKYGFLRFKASSYCKLDISAIFPNYFIMQEDEDEETISEDDIVYLVLTYMSFIYYKEKEGLFNDSSLIYDLDLEYQLILRNKIYPEILTLYRMILESKTHDK